MISQSSELSFCLTISEDEALYLFDALRQMNPTDAHYGVIGGDPIYRELWNALDAEGVNIDFLQGTYAQPL